MRVRTLFLIGLVFWILAVISVVIIVTRSHARMSGVAVISGENFALPTLTPTNTHTLAATATSTPTKTPSPTLTPTATTTATNFPLTLTATSNPFEPTREGTIVAGPSDTPLPLLPSNTPMAGDPLEGSSTAVASGNTVIITVVAGDTLFGLAARYNVSVDQIARANGLTEDGLIFVGQSLVIPSRVQPSFTPAFSIPTQEIIRATATSTMVRDTDHDGFPDDRDKCPFLPGPEEGCPVKEPTIQLPSLTASVTSTSTVSLTPTLDETTIPTVTKVLTTPIIIPPPGPQSIIEENRPTVLNIADSDSVKISLIRPAPGLPATSELEITSTTGVVTAIPSPVGTPSSSLSKAFGPNYNAYLTADLVGAAFDIQAAGPNEQSMADDRVTWIWNISPKKVGVQKLDVVINAQWKPFDSGPTIQHRIWDNEYTIVVNQPIIEVGQLSILALVSGLLGSGLTFPFIIGAIRDRRQRQLNTSAGRSIVP